MKSIGVEIRFEKENIHSLTADGELLLTILAGFAEEESRAISENIKWAFRKKFERGEQWHVPPFGYRWNGETFVIDEHEAEAVRKIFDDYLNNSPVAITASWLKERGFPHSKTFITNALKNYVYIGRVITQKSFTENHRTHKRIANVGQLPRYVIDDNHESIIDRETFEEVQRRLENDAAFMKARARPTKRPFGYKWENGGYAIIPKEAEAVKLMYKYYIKGWSVTKISTTLSQHGYHTRTGKLSNRIVDRVLDSDFYIGGKQVKGQNAYELDFKHEPIIDKASFDTVQRLRKERGHNRKEDKP